MEWLFYIIASLFAGIGTGLAGNVILGASMLILNYRSLLPGYPFFTDTLKSLLVFITYIVPCVIAIVIIRFFTGIPSFIFRKLLHIIAFSCITLMIVTTDSWIGASLASITIAVVIYPALKLFESASWYDHLFVQKSPGEIKKSLLLLFFMFAGVIAFSWGIFGKPYVAAASVLMWGTGDAAAALVGIPFGKHRIKLPGTDGKKSVEGSLAMLFVCFICGITVLYFNHIKVEWAIPAAMLAAAAGTATELFSPSEYDTVTVPVVISIVLLFSHI